MLLWGSVCHHVKREASQLHPIFAHATIIMKQAAAVGRFKNMKGVFTTAGGVHDSLKKELTPEGLLLGYNTMYFDDPKGSPVLKQFVRECKSKYNEYPPYECDRAYFNIESYKVAVERAYAATGKRPTRPKWSRRSRASRPNRFPARGRGGRTTSKCATSTRA